MRKWRKKEGIVMNKFLLFTGAGLSVPLGLPITTGFEEIIHRCPAPLSTYIGQYLQGAGNDIEKVVSTIELFLNKDTLLDSIINQMGPDNGNFGAVEKEIRRFRGDGAKFLIEVKSGMYDVLDNYDRASATTLYLNIIREIRSYSPDSSISFFTTNYDLTFESTAYHSREEFSALGIRDIVYCFQPIFGTFAFDKTQKFEWEPALLEYIKLHGSLDWQSDDEVVCTKSGTATKPANPNKSPLLYPGFKGIPSVEPFVSFHERLMQRLHEAEVIIVAGFAFRDPYINKLFEFLLKSNEQHVYCINPASADDLPSESAIPAFTAEFPHFHHIQKKIELTLDPLDLETILQP